MTILITGGAGFIGSQLALRLVREGRSVVVLDNFDDFYDPSLKRANVRGIEKVSGDFELIEGDIRDVNLIEKVLSTRRIRNTVHLAAMANVRYSLERGRLYADVNVSATVSLLDAACRYGVEAFVFGSTSSVYGNSAAIPFREDDPAIAPLAPYPASKRAAEIFASTYHHLHGLNVTILRFFNVYGPHGRPDMMPMRVIKDILAEKPIPLFGGGLLKRDWTYIDDIVDGIASALKQPDGLITLNLGCGNPITLLRFIEIYQGLIGKPAIRIDADAPTSEPLITYCDNSRARRLLGFEPAVGIEEGLARTWEWYRQTAR